MPTRPLPPGTCNGSVNLPVPMWRQFARLAHMHDQAAGARLRELIAADLAAARARGLQIVHDTRQLVLTLASCLVLAAGIFATAWAAVVGDNELRRPARFSRPAASITTLKIRHRRGGFAA